ncbi:Glutamate 5-kinase [Folsomia candida]|uniref:Glutamate 5-kinase n=1 Tax=Folsomia candida TaxID=158441 RepID=A0A226CUK2_FOLCA|nr:Glutamate 5-kinase [Folsomia candida]
MSGTRCNFRLKSRFEPKDDSADTSFPTKLAPMMNPKQKKKDDLEVEEGTSCQIVVEKGTVKIQVCRTLHKPDRVDFWGEPLSEYHIHGVELMLSNEDSMNVLTKLMQFLELPQTQEEKMLTFGEHVKNVIASIMQAAKNGEMVVTRKLLTDIVRSSEGLPNDNPYA